MIEGLQTSYRQENDSLGKGSESHALLMLDKPFEKQIGVVHLLKCVI